MYVVVKKRTEPIFPMEYWFQQVTFARLFNLLPGNTVWIKDPVGAGIIAFAITQPVFLHRDGITVYYGHNQQWCQRFFTDGDPVPFFRITDEESAEEFFREKPHLSIVERVVNE